MLRLIPLGGLGEIGLNMMALDCEGYMLVIDAGLMFPDDYMPGVDLVIPDFHFLRKQGQSAGGHPYPRA
jgi:ribonuclease J